ncbi:MAG TPA: hypothetical protein DGJ56_06675 [Verrucomicrobiales bacterium]|nr:hypothetical protein [Verrucomicrobiales bacterium]
MIETASQPIPAKPALSLVTRSGLLLAATPSHLRLGRWPDSIGDKPDTPLFQMHTELVWIYFTALLFSLFAVPLIIAVLVFLPPLPRVCRAPRRLLHLHQPRLDTHAPRPRLLRLLVLRLIDR